MLDIQRVDPPGQQHQEQQQAAAAGGGAGSEWCMHRFRTRFPRPMVRPPFGPFPAFFKMLVACGLLGTACLGGPQLCALG